MSPANSPHPGTTILLQVEGELTLAINFSSYTKVLCIRTCTFQGENNLCCNLIGQWDTCSNISTFVLSETIFWLNNKTFSLWSITNMSVIDNGTFLHCQLQYCTCRHYETEGCISMEPAGLHTVSLIPVINTDRVKLCVLILCLCAGQKKTVKCIKPLITRLKSVLPFPTQLHPLCVLNRGNQNSLMFWLYYHTTVYALKDTQERQDRMPRILTYVNWEVRSEELTLYVELL